MTLDRTFINRNQAERERLNQLATRITDEELTHTVDNAWTVATVFAHLAFWDRQRLELINYWEPNGFVPCVYPAHPFNAAMETFFGHVPPRQLVALAVAHAEALDSKIASLSDDMIAQIRAQPDAPNLERALHRQEHLAQLAAIGIHV